jgi:hypothetical protein
MGKPLSQWKLTLFFHLTHLQTYAGTLLWVMRSDAAISVKLLNKKVPASMAFIFLERHTKANGFFFMEPSTQYRKFAEECGRFAQIAKTDEQRKVLLQMEAVWTKLAEEAEARAVKSRD